MTRHSKLKLLLYFALLSFVCLVFFSSWKAVGQPEGKQRGGQGMMVRKKQGQEQGGNWEGGGGGGGTRQQNRSSLTVPQDNNNKNKNDNNNNKITIIIVVVTIIIKTMILFPQRFFMLDMLNCTKQYKCKKKTYA